MHSDDSDDSDYSYYSSYSDDNSEARAEEIAVLRAEENDARVETARLEAEAAKERVETARLEAENAIMRDAVALGKQGLLLRKRLLEIATVDCWRDARPRIDELIASELGARPKRRARSSRSLSIPGHSS